MQLSEFPTFLRSLRRGLWLSVLILKCFWRIGTFNCVMVFNFLFKFSREIGVSFTQERRLTKQKLISKRANHFGSSFFFSLFIRLRVAVDSPVCAMTASSFGAFLIQSQISPFALPGGAACHKVEARNSLEQLLRIPARGLVSHAPKKPIPALLPPLKNQNPAAYFCCSVLSFFMFSKNVSSPRQLYPEIPYGIYMIMGRSFMGFHIRFRDVSRGGNHILFLH